MTLNTNTLPKISIVIKKSNSRLLEKVHFLCFNSIVKNKSGKKKNIFFFSSENTSQTKDMNNMSVLDRDSSHLNFVFNLKII